MAKKASFRDLYGKWSAQEERANAAQNNKLASAKAILDAVQQDGTELSDDQYTEALAQIMNTGKLDTSSLSGYAKPATSVVLPTAVDKAMPQMSATTSQSVLDSIRTVPSELASDLGANFRAAAREVLAGLVAAPAVIANLATKTPASMAISSLTGVELPIARNPAVLDNEATRLRDEAKTIRNTERSDRARVGTEVLADTQGFTDTAQAYLTNPTVLADELATQAGQLYASTPGALGGSTGLIVAQGASAASNQGQQAYEDVIAKGGSKAQADRARDTASTISLAANIGVPLSVPGGTALERLLVGQATGAARRSVVGAAAVPLVGEAASEALTEVLDQGGLNFATGEPMSRGLAKAAAAGAVLGGVMGGAPAINDVRNTATEINERAASTESDILSGAERVRAPVLPAETVTTPAQEDIVSRIDNNPNVDRELFNVEQDISSDAARTSALDEAFSQREQEDALQKRVEEEAGFRTIANQTNSSGTMAEGLRQAGVETEVTPQQVADEMLQANAERNRQSQLEASRTAMQQEQEAQVRTINDVARTREAFRKQQEKAQASQDKKAKIASASQRTAAIKELIADNPNATDADIARLLPDRVDQMKQAENIKNDEVAKKIQAIRNQIEGQRKKKLGEADRRRLNSLVKNNPDVSVADLSARFKSDAGSIQPSPTGSTTSVAPVANVTKLKNSADPLDRIQGMVAERLGMSGTNSAPTADFGSKVKTISRRLAGDTSQRAAGVEKLINQGKIVIVPNAEAAGRESTGRKGEYDVGQGTTYIYTDNLTDGTHAELMEAAAHESGHLGQFNERDQRPEMMKSLLGRGVTKASDILRKSAASGNTFAQEALSRAAADTEARRAAGEENPERYENEELVAYAIGQENAGRAKSLGSASGAIRDAVSGAREQLRKRLGVNLDLNAADVRTAMASILQEATQTDTAATSDTDSLGLIYGESAADFNKAKEEGRVYTSTSDGKGKFVISDADASMKPDAGELLAGTLLSPDSTVTAGQIMDHDILYRNMPEARNVEIRVATDMTDRNMGKYWPGRNLIEVSPNVANGKSQATLKEVVLHEMQHWAQEQEGGTGVFQGVVRTPAERKTISEFEKVRDANDQAGVNMMQLAGRIVNEMPGKTNKAVARNIINSSRTPSRKALDFARLVDDSEMKIQDTEAKEAYNQFSDTLNQYRNKVEGYNKVQQELHRRYTSLPTEAEAFFTQRNADVPQSELPTNPEMEDWEFGTAEGADVGRMALMRTARSDLSGETLGMAGDNFNPSTGTTKVEGTVWQDKNSASNLLKAGNYLETELSDGTKVKLVNRQDGKEGVVEVRDANNDEYGLGYLSYGMQVNGQGNRQAPRVYVDDINRRKGVARLMYQTAQKSGGLIPAIDARNADRTDDGAALRQGLFDEGTLGMAGNTQSTDTAFRNRNKATTLLVSALRNDKGLGAHIRDEVELAKAAPVEFEAQANRAAGQYDSGVEKLALDRGVSPAEINAEIRGRLEEISNLDGTASEYKAAFDNIVKDYGQAGKALSRLRNLVDDLSADFIQTYLDSGKKLTEKEKDDIKKVAANLGRYVHRFYASRQGHGLGKKYSQAVQDAIDKAKEGKKSLTPKEQELYDRYANASKRILEGVVIPEDLESLSGSNIDYLYDTWIGTDPTLVDRDGKEAALADIRDDVGMEDMQAKADAAVQSLLWGVENTAAARFYDRGEKLNTSIMQKRKSIPKEIRDLLGEVTDPAGALVATVSKQAEYVARTKLMLALRNMAASEDLQPPGSSGNAAVRNNNMKELTGEAYGPLQGYWASPSMVAMIGDTTEQLQNFTDAMITGHQNFDGVWNTMGRMAANGWMRAASGAKAINIVGNLWRYPLNLAGSFAMLGVNGNLNVGSYGKGLKDSVDIIRYSAKPSSGLGGADIASKYRVVDSATVGDLKNLDVGKIEQIVREMSGKSPGTFMRKARELGMAGKELYAMMDVWSKLANFHGEVDFLRSMYKSEGLTKTDDEIYREASAVVNNTNMSYSRTLPFLKALERGGVTQYGPYLYEAHRVVAANLYQGLLEVKRAADLNNPAAQAKMAARGLARMTGTAGVLAMLGALSHFAAGMWGDDEEDRRALLPEYARVMDFLPVGKDSEGRPIIYGVSNADPLGPITDLYRAARISDKPTEALWKQFKENYIAPALGGALWDAAAHTTGVIPATSPRPRKPLVAQWFPEGWSSAMSTVGNEDAWNSVASLIETRYMPGTPRAWSDSNPIAVGGGSDDVVYNTMRGLGARALRYDPEVGTRDASFGYDDTIKNLRRDLAAYVENTTNPSAEEVTSRLLDMRKEERKAWEQLAKTRRGMLSLGMTDAEADAALKEAKVPTEVITQLGNEEYVSRVINQNSISSAAKTQIRKAKTEADKEKLQDKWESSWEILSELQGGE